MSQEASSELLDIENKISKIQEQIERLEDNIDEKWSTLSSMKKRCLSLLMTIWSEKIKPMQML